MTTPIRSALFSGIAALSLCGLALGQGSKEGSQAASQPSLPAALRFYAPFDTHCRGLLLPQRTGVAAGAPFVRADGKVGSAAECPKAGIEFPLAPLLSNEEGSVAFWARIDWDPKKPGTYKLFDLGKFASIYRFNDQPYLTFALWYHHLDEQHDYACTAPMTGWAAGQWRHLAITWSVRDKQRSIYIDGEKIRQGRIDRPPNVISTFRIGPDVGAVDELCVYREAIPPAEVKRLFDAGQGQPGRPAFVVGEIPAAMLAAATLPDEPPSAPPRFVNWSFDGAEQSDNGHRGEITLHGWWRWQRGQTAFDPPDAAVWLYRKVPAHSSFTESFPVRDAKFDVVRGNDPRVGRPANAANLNGLMQWCQREFSLPPAWRGRRILLNLDSLRGDSAIYLNGRLLDTLPHWNLGGRYDITGRVRWDSPNRLTFFCGGVDGDVTLLSLPTGPAIEDAWLETSWRAKTLTAHLRVSAPAAEPVVAQVIVSTPADRPEGSPEGSPALPSKRIESRVALKPGENTIDLADQWPDVIPWSPGRPHLYSFIVTITQANGEELDATLPARFGFREIWIEGGDFMLNGRPIHFIGHSNSHLTAASEQGDPAYLRYSLRQWAKAGMNCVTPWQGEDRYPTFHPLLDAADELGMAIIPNVNLPTGEGQPEDPSARAAWNRLYETYVRRYRQHPSLLAWMVGSGAHNFDFCPAVMDGRFMPDVPRIAPLKATWDVVRKLDPTRPVFGLSNGNAGAVWTSMAYQGFDEDLQQRENWPMRWAERRAKPLMPCEFSLPFPSDWLARMDQRTARAQYYPPDSQSLATEYAAMLLGPSVYAVESADYVRTLGDSPGSPQKSASYWPVKMLFADTLRAWRAYGISFVYHAEVPGMFTGNRPTFPSVAKLDPRRRSATPEDLAGSLQAADELSEFGKRIRDVTAPLIAFIGGPDGRFTLKDHAFWSGETVRKTLVVVNDTEAPVEIDANWSLADAAGKVVAGDRVKIHVDAGRRDIARAVIQFVAPPIEKRTDFTLTVEAKTATGQAVPVAPFPLTIFPPDKPAEQMPAQVVLFDPAGRTTAALGRLGLHPASMPDRLTGKHRLIVGSRSLEKPADRKALADAGFDQAVLDGMRVLVFEQASPNWDGTLMGLRMKRLATRRAFVRSPDHPALAGLADADFKFLRGDSDLIDAFPDPGPMPAEYPVHFWHFGNDNIVATFALEKPQVGAAAAILDCGFDLAESPLLETARGAGLLVFCQVDVTNRAGVEPVSTRLVRNLIGYLATGARPAGGTGLPPEKLADLARRNPPGGGAASIDAFVSAVPPIAGLHAGETFFRQRLHLPAFDAASPTPLFRRVAVGKQECWTTSLSATDLNTDWQRTKLARINAALRFANGERPPVGPTLSAFDDPAELYPFRWTHVGKMQADFDPYVYWRW